MPPAALRDLRLDEAVELALAQNLDIAVERLSPQVTDFQIAGLRGAYRPVASSSLGQRSQVNPPTNQLNGGQRVANDTTTYNFGVSKIVPWGGGNFLMQFNNSRLATNNLFANYNPNYTSTLTATYNQPLLRGFRIDAVRQQIAVTQVNREIAEEALRSTIAVTIANVRNAYWDLAYARAAVDVGAALARARREAGRGQPGAGRGRHAGPDRRRPGRGRGRHPAPDPRPGRSHARHRATVAQAPTSSPAPATRCGRQELRAVDVPQLDSTPIDIEGAVRRALERRTDLEALRKNLDSNDITLRYWRNESRPALDLQVNYGAQGIGGTQFIREGSGIGSQVTGTIPGGYNDALSLLGARDFPTWNAALAFSYPIGGSTADAQHARTRVLRNQQSTRLRALELTVAAEVTNAALQIACEPPPRGRGPGGARAGGAAARGRAEQVRSRPLDQLLRGPGAARPGRRRERGTARPDRHAEVPGDLRTRPGIAGQRHRRRRAADGGPERRHHRHRRTTLDAQGSRARWRRGRSGRRTVYAEQRAERLRRSGDRGRGPAGGRVLAGRL